MNWKDYITPIIIGIIFLASSLIFSNELKIVLQTNNFSSEIFTFSSLLFGLILTSYSMLFGVIPSIKKEFRTSPIMKDINSYFRSCLLVLLITIISSIIYMFFINYILFIVNITLLGINIGFFGYIIFLVNDIFEFVSQEGNS